MKRILFTILLLPLIYLANAQDYRLYIDDNGRPTDMFKATSYIVVKKLADTAWQMQNYDMENVILQSGTFKDRNLQIQNGKFLYYRRLNFYNNKQMKEWFRSDTVNCIMTEGSFKNGKKDGLWTDYFIGGKVREQAFYKEGVLNGSYRSYNDDQTTVALSGNYVDGKRDGEWDVMSLKGQLIEKDKYRDGKVTSRKMMIHNYNSPKPPKGFETYINRAFRKAVTQQNIKEMLIDFTVTIDGKIIKPHASSFEQDNDPIVKTVFGIIENSPAWKPANQGDDTKPLEDFAMISVEINNGEVTTKVLDNATFRTLFYNLNSEK